MRPPGFEPGSRAREAGIEEISEINEDKNDKIDYRKVREDFIKWMYERCSR